MAQGIGQSIPKQCQSWGQVKAAYRLLSNPAVQPAAIIAPHQQMLREQCASHPLVLCVQDDTHLSVHAQQQQQHTTLAVLPDRTCLGVLDVRWFNRVEADECETRRQREARWRESCIWSDAVDAVGAAPVGCRFIHVCDRAADDLNVFESCFAAGCGFVIRARHDRRIQQGQHRLFGFLADAKLAGTTKVQVGPQRRKGKIIKQKRSADVSIRFAQVQVCEPLNHPGRHAPRLLWAVYLKEDDPPAEAEPIEWMLLSSEPLRSLSDALRIIGYYQCRWVIEEFHRCMKEGCRLEHSQLDQPADHRRLAAIVSVLAVRLLQLRDAANDPEAQDATALHKLLPPIWLMVIAKLAQVNAQELTPQRLWQTVARRGGWLGRNSDGPPGWKVIWRGWSELQLLVQGAELLQTNHPYPRGSG